MLPTPRRNKGFELRTRLSYTFLMAISIFSFVLTFCILWSPAQASYSTHELEGFLSNMRGSDDRLVRWDATEATLAKQQTGGCDALPAALAMLSQEVELTKQRLICEFATFCITDNPTQRAIFANQPKIHAAVVKLLDSTDPMVSSSAAHVIYIATFADKENHQGFFGVGAVEALARIVKDGSVPGQVMWALAALQNMAASYCATEDDGRCYWFWSTDDIDHVIITEDSLPMLSTGGPTRKAILADPMLVEAMKRWACTGPVQGPPSNKNIHPGVNAKINQDEDAKTVVAWAAAGALKNLALEPNAKPLIEDAMSCACYLSHSVDWLEENKGQGVLHHMRRADPCWFEDDGLCIDQYFYDEEGYNCGDYENASEDECEAISKSNAIPAHKACCACGGGVRTAYTHEEL